MPVIKNSSRGRSNTSDNCQQQQQEQRAVIMMDGSDVV